MIKSHSYLLLVYLIELGGNYNELDDNKNGTLTGDYEGERKKARQYIYLI